MDNARLKTLLQRYLKNDLSAGELQELLELMRGDASYGHLQQAIEQALTENSFAGAADKSRADVVFRGIMEKAAEVAPRKRISLYHMAAAAAVILVAGALSLLFLHPFQPEKPGMAHSSGNTKKAVSPGTNKALLTLADGSTVVLDSAGSGTVAQQGNTRVLNLGTGRLVYTPGQTTGSIVYNTISTPRGGQFQVVLPDGSKVWLNAASSVRIPSAFTGHERQVELTGEAYFEIAHNKEKPFRVIVGETEVKVLGTHFIINAYANEPVLSTTLLEGRVTVRSKGKEVALIPGQQARVKEGIKVLEQVDTEALTAWMNGRFSFNNAGLDVIMRQIGRWYDVEVRFNSTITDTYSVDISRQVPLPELLRFLELSGGVRFTMNGNKIVVDKN
ncbi:DUF4974 domain-containing protein [Chitinophaga lutea]|uniref:DUF4974 domain-containing protein n=1 Tax=Chitinophaga lutea TaxID=2488634 RepID=A0A3N4PDK0_9BACT|nr:FecR family protein [Chitinophaga lutea]RPE05498.1 DUF4974 domain-containing protein [Chitinophaga lutea]